MLLEPSRYRSCAKESLAAAEKPGRIILIHTGITLLLSLLLLLADYLLDQEISKTGGISGMGTRSVLTTVQALLLVLQLVLLPFWQLGYTYYTLRVARGEKADLQDLKEGFRRFGPILRLKLLTFGMMIALTFASSYAASFLFMMTPWSVPILEEMEPMITEGLSYMEMTEVLMTRLQDFVIPLMILFFLCFAAGGVFLFLKYRLAELWLMDHPDKGAFAALRGSRLCMRGSKKSMLRIDLSFWWFYALELLIFLLGFGDQILEAVGLEMTIDAFGVYLIFFCLSLWAQLMLYWWKKNEVCVTYAHAYLSLCPPESQNEQ